VHACGGGGGGGCGGGTCGGAATEATTACGESGASWRCSGAVSRRLYGRRVDGQLRPQVCLRGEKEAGALLCCCVPAAAPRVAAALAIDLSLGASASTSTTPAASSGSTFARAAPPGLAAAAAPPPRFWINGLIRSALFAASAFGGSGLRCGHVLAARRRGAAPDALRLCAGALYGARSSSGCWLSRSRFRTCRCITVTGQRQ